MLLSLGPVPTEDVDNWVRFARRVMCEIRMDPGDLGGIATPELLDEWSRLISQWESSRATANKAEWFRWSSEIGDERAEYLLYSMGRCMEWARKTSRLSDEDRARHSAVSLHVVQGFVDGLLAEGHHHEHYVDQIRASIGAGLDH